MTELVGAKAIADELGRLSGFAVSEWQVYRLAAQRTPITQDREQWKVRASASELRSWWETSRLAGRFAKRLKQQALGRHGVYVAKRKHSEVRAQARGELRVVGIVGVDDLSTNAFLDALKALGDVESIRLLINSDGGLVSDGLAIYHALRQHKAKVEVEIIGVAASMASAIAMAGDKVSMAEDALFMLHDPWTSAAGNADDLRAAADMLDKHGDSLAGIYARRTKFTEAEILDLMGKNGGDGTWLNAEEALEMGFVDEILSPAEARLPNLPAAALAKRINRKGAKGMKKFAAKLAELIAAMVKGDTSKEDVIDDLAVESEMTVEQVEQVVEGKAFPTLAQLRAFAEVLNVAPKELRALAEADGHKFEAKKEPKEPAQQPANRGQQQVVASADVGAAVRDALAADRARQREIRAEAARFGLPESVVQSIVDEATDVADARKRILNQLASGQTRINGINGHVTMNEDERDKWLEGMSQWLLIKSGQARLIEAHAKKGGQTARLDAGQFRGLRLLDIARDSLERRGINCRGMSPREIAKRALVRAEHGLGTTSDFPVLLENVLHKMLLAAYETAPDQWRSVVAVGSVQDFRAHPRLRIGSLSTLDAKLETGEFKQKHFPDAEKETIRAATKGNIIGLSREAIVNDDVDGFSRLTTMLGRAAMLSIEVDVFNLIASGSGLGPTMSDGATLFHASHSNIASSAGAPSVETLEAARVLMAQQKDPEGNEYLNLRPAVWVGPIGLGAAVRTAVNSEFDFDALTTGEGHKFMKPNVVRDLVSVIVDTPRLSGTRWYLLADPMIAPVYEVAFLQGQETPQIETEEGFDYDGIRWRVMHDYGVGAIDWRGAVTNAGA